MPFLKTTLALLAFIACSITTVIAQIPNYKFTQITPESGLANSDVSDIIQDKKGFIWIATDNGLQRFDGLRFSTWRFQMNDKRSLTSDIVGKLLEDDQQNLWIACSNGVARMNRFRQAPQRIPIAGFTGEVLFQPLRFFQDSKKNIWLITRPKGIFWYDPKAGQFVEAIKKLPFNNQRNFNMEEEPATGNFWIGGDSGIAYIDVARRQYYDYRNNPLKIPLLADARFYKTIITGMKLDNKGTLWINTFFSDYPRSSNIKYDSYYYNTANGQLTYFKAPVPINYHYELDDENNLWLLGEEIFSVKVGDKFIKIPVDKNNAYSLKSNRVNCLMEDKNRNRWIGTDEGVFVFNPEENKMGRTTAFDDNKKKLNLTPLQFLELPGGKIWMSTWGHGIMEYDENFNPVRKIDPAAGSGDGNNDMIWVMLKAKDNRVWLGCQSGRIMIFDPKTNSFQKLIPPEFDLRTVRTAAEDHNGNIWFGTQHGLIIKYDFNAKKFIRYAYPSYPAKEGYGNINQLMVDDDNVLWACTAAAGLLKINVTTGQVFEHFQHVESEPNSIAGNTLNTIIQYNDTLYVVATAMGINFLNTKTKKFTYLTTMDGLPSNTILTLKKDRLNNIWAGTNGYLVKVTMPLKNIVVMGKKEGVANETFQMNATELLSDGRIVAGTTDDFIYFQPKTFQSSLPPPDVQITGFKVFNQDINFDSVLSKRKRIWLPYTQNFIRIEYSPLGFLNDNLTYYYKLEGVDKDWVRGSADLSANYANLSPGNYTFLIRSENDNGISSRKTTSIAFNIRSPFWETWWFLFLLAIIAAAALYFVHRIRVNRLIAMEAVRSRIARDLHDDMGSTLSTINILSEMAQMKIEKDAALTKGYIAKIGDNCSRMMEAMDDIVWSINPLNDNMQKITARMREYATNLLEAKDIEYTFQVDEAVKFVKLDMEARRDFFLIFKEAVNNLVKYSQCRHAQIKIEVYEYNMCMKIQDDGKGFVVKEADSGNGLTNMTKRAQSLNSKIHIESQPGVGTKILLEVNFA